jgi:protein TonB
MNQADRWFYNALTISFILHIFVLTFLVTKPITEDNHEFKELKIKLGVNKSGLSGAGKDLANNPYFAQAATANAAAVQGAFMASIGVTALQNAPTTELLSESVPEIPEIIEPATPELVTEIEEPKDSKEKEEKPAEVSDKEGLKKETKEPAKEAQKQPKPESALDQQLASMPSYTSQGQVAEGEGRYLGNSAAVDAKLLTSYEQMLPLWLDKFRTYPEEAINAGISGRGDVFIKIDRNGKVLLSKVTKSTGSEILDKALIKMVEDADPVIPVPAGYYEGRKTFSYRITFEFLL